MASATLATLLTTPLNTFALIWNYYVINGKILQCSKGFDFLQLPTDMENWCFGVPFTSNSFNWTKKMNSYQLKSHVYSTHFP